MNWRVEGVPNKPVLSTAPTLLDEYPLGSLRRHIGQPLDCGATRRRGISVSSDGGMTESAMYEKVRDFVVSYWGTNDSLTFYDHGKHAADGEGVSISFGGIRVEPDIYGIASSGAFEIPLLGEGKLRMGGANGTNAVRAAIT